MFRRILLTALAAAALAAPAPAPAQAAGAAAAPPPEVQRLLQEMQQVEGTLMAIQAKALKSPDIAREKEQLEADVRAAILRVDPKLKADMDRIPALQKRAVEAQKSGNEAAFRQAMTEGQQLQTRLVRAQQKAMSDRGLMTRMQSFQARLTRKMTEVDSRTQGLLNRFQQLGANLERMARAAPGPRR